MRSLDLWHNVLVDPGPADSSRGAQRERVQPPSAGLFLLVAQERLVDGVRPRVSLAFRRAAHRPRQLHRNVLVNGLFDVSYYKPERMGVVRLGGVNAVFGEEDRRIERDYRRRRR